MSFEVPQHLLTGKQLAPSVFERISETTQRLQNPKELERAKREIKDRYPLGAAALALFLEPSSRTRYSSLRACARLDLPAFQEPHPEATLSLLKGESWEDTFLTFDALGYQLIFFRSNMEGDADRAAENTEVSVITNCGDGKKHHPSQAALDGETIKKTFGKFDGLTIAYVGDPAAARTAHSLLDMLAYHDTHHIFSTHPDMTLDPDYIKELNQRGVSYEIMHDITKAARKAQIIYMNRHQTERIQKKAGESDEELEARKKAKGDEYLKETQISPESTVLRIIEEKGVRIMHAFPRNQELPAELTRHPQGLFIDQMRIGVSTRTATSYLQLTGQLFESMVEFNPDLNEQAA
jgi:aspartate carbamoyltransferase catalytic subunit